MDRMWQPANFGCDAARPVSQRIAYRFAHAVRATDAVEELRLQDAGDTKRGGCEENAKGRGGSDEQVLLFVNVKYF